MWWVEEGGPRVGAKRRGGDPLPQCQAQSQNPPASGQQGVRLGCSPYRRTPKRTPRRTPPHLKRTPETDTGQDQTERTHYAAARSLSRRYVARRRQRSEQNRGDGPRVPRSGGISPPQCSHARSGNGSPPGITSTANACSGLVAGRRSHPARHASTMPESTSSHSARSHQAAFTADSNAPGHASSKLTPARQAAASCSLSSTGGSPATTTGARRRA